ncbi:hypothetical protein E4634_04410 [Mangrovimicrobium sediminis]|uniref:Sulfotransferase family protein n=1 Tax=Mangrovimicrobium sediminis TaxID=2562682 RepID=A0A4Z0M7F9_9GAMM|nr:hypothetical protein [Haliea sp. SAOS-164]TGD75245.1 hypothetical protein E4634_04410 [Haliea sp. SAOS-164]
MTARICLVPVNMALSRPMILSPDILFIHIPKTAGVSCTDFLCDNLRGPVAYFSIHAVLGQKAKKYRRANLYPGFNHETLEEVLAEKKRIHDLSGLDVEDVGKILTVIRHPYDLEASSYRFFRNAGNNWLRAFSQDRSILERIELARGSFKEFVAGSGYFRKRSGAAPGDPGYRTEEYFQVDGMLPPKLHILKFEELGTDLPALIEPYCDGAIEGGFPHTNRSVGRRQQAIDIHIDDETRALIADKHQWVFDQGFYER